MDYPFDHPHNCIILSLYRKKIHVRFARKFIYFDLKLLSSATKLNPYNKRSPYCTLSDLKFGVATLVKKRSAFYEGRVVEIVKQNA